MFENDRLFNTYLHNDRLVIADPFDQRWLDYVNRHPKANIFHHSQWTAFLSECYGFKSFVVAVENPENRLCAGLPMMEMVDPLRGRRWVALPFSDHCAPLFDDGPSLARLKDHLQTLFQKRKSTSIELRWNEPDCMDIPCCAKYAFHQIHLSQDFKVNVDRIHPMHRRNAQTAIKKGLRLTWGSDQKYLQEFYRLHLQTRQRQGVPIQPRKFFDLLYKRILAQGLGSIWLVYQDNQCLAGALFLHWQSTFTYKFGASDTQFWSLKPNDFLFWNAIQWACEHQFTLFDMGRSDLDNPGLCSFKRGWGAQETLLNYRRLSNHLPPLDPGNLKKLMRFVIQKSPGRVCQMLGEILYPYSG